MDAQGRLRIVEVKSSGAFSLNPISSRQSFRILRIQVWLSDHVAPTIAQVAMVGAAGEIVLAELEPP